MNEYAVKYRRYDAINKETVQDTKWFNNYDKAVKFAKKHFARVYEGWELIEENTQRIRAAK